MKVTFGGLLLLALISCRAGRPVPGLLALSAPEPTVFKYVFLLTKNEGEMLVDYDSYQDRVAIVEESNERWTVDEFKERLSHVPAGGNLYVAWTRPHVELAKPGNCTVIVYSSTGQERERFAPDFYLVRNYFSSPGQMMYEHGSTNHLRKPVRNGSRVEVIDRTTNQHLWFLLRTKPKNKHNKAK